MLKLLSFFYSNSAKCLLDTGYHTQETLDSMLAGLADLGLEMSDTDLFISHIR